MAKKPEPTPPGRPTVVTDGTVAILIASFHNGLNISQACLQAGISRDAYYDHMRDDPDFAAKMELAQNFPSMKARQVLVTKINQGDEATAKWWIERKDREEFSLRTETDLTTKGKELPTPILGGMSNGVQPNDSDQQTSEA